MFRIEEEAYDPMTGRLLFINIEENASGGGKLYSHFNDAFQSMMNYARAMGRVAMIDPAGTFVVVVDTTDGENLNYRYIIARV